VTIPIDAIFISVASLGLSALAIFLSQRHQRKYDDRSDTERLTRMEEALKQLPEISADVKSLLARVTRLEGSKEGGEK